jgi:hypothetical protein
MATLERNSNKKTEALPAQSEDVMRAAKCTSKVLKGLFFDILDLILIKDWSAAHDIRMVVQLDYGSDVDEYEEVLSFYSGTSTKWRWMMWRNVSAVFVRSIEGRSRRYRSAARAIKALVRKEDDALTEIKATHSHPFETVRSLQGLLPPSQADNAGGQYR